ncbi:MAG: hypothetical protein KGM49_00635 [Sphingomonadales bacterium]|nr:hypothetical protein [Sphingomonadales bacterium]
MNIVDAFVVTFGLDSSGFKKGEKDVSEATRKMREANKRAFDEMEQRGKKAAEAFRSVRNETVGMFLAFMGASSLTGMIGGMFKASVSADRLGQSMGVSAARVRAWRQAMKEVGSDPSQGDAALQKIAQDQQDWRLTGQTASDAQYRRFGITPSDLINKDASDILLKISKAGEGMKKPEFARRLQMMGLSQDVVNLLMQGHDAVSRAISTGEKNAALLKDQEKNMQDLQKTMADLQNTIVNKLVPPLADIAGVLNRWLGGKDSSAPTKGGDEHVWGIPGIFEFKHPGNKAPRSAPSSGSTSGAHPGGDHPSSANEGTIHHFLTGKGAAAGTASGILAGIVAEGGTLGMAANGAFGIGQWRGERAKRLFSRFGRNPGLMQQLEFLWWELTGGDRGGRSVLSQKSASSALMAYITNFMRPQGQRWEHRSDWAADIQRGQRFLRTHGGGTTVHISQVTIHTKATDGKAVARDFRAELGRRTMVNQANSGLMA